MVVVFGSINLDLIARAPRIAVPGETLTGTAFTTAPGGKGANQALAARRAGAQVALIGVVGRDAFAATALANLEREGVDLGGVTAADVPTGVALVTVDDRGENAITVVPGANALACARSVPDALLAPGTTVLMQLEVPLTEVEALARRAHVRGARVVLNAAPAATLSAALLAHVSLLIVNEHEAEHLARAWSLPPALASLGPVLHARAGCDVVVTLGARGALLHGAGGSSQHAPQSIDVVDTTGAGDALAGALVAALDRGASGERALHEGVVAGALACTRHGAQAAMPDATRLAAAMRDVESSRHPPPIG
jgi:ribokinase